MQEITVSIQNYASAVQKLEQGVESVADDLDIDGVIQRFEFTFELFWKTLKLILEYEGFTCQSPRSCIKEGYRRGYINDGEIFLDMLADRNQTTHLYDMDKTREIYDRIRHPYLEACKQAYNNFVRFKE